MIEFAIFQRGICRSGKLITGNWPRVQRIAVRELGDMDIASKIG